MDAEVCQCSATLQPRHIFFDEASMETVHIERLHEGQDWHQRTIDEIQESPDSSVVVGKCDMGEEVPTAAMKPSSANSAACDEIRGVEGEDLVNDTVHQFLGEVVHGS
jgi:hypothetical protein